MSRRKLITVAALAVLALACSETVGGVMQDAGDMLADAGDMLSDAGDMMQPDAGAQQSELFTFDCNGENYVLTDIDFEYGKTVDHTRHPADRYGFDSTRPLDFARYSSFSIDGKVLAACNGADTVTVEVLP